MIEIEVKAKGTYLKEHYPFEDVPKLSDKKLCIHCDKVFTVKDFKVFKDETGFEYICCPNALECDGTVIDWFSVDEEEKF
ncbi:hypothetical protein [Mucilaginibacter celer]|uniref:Uncharacterized protein n=1 Tax=Mucilaginibacter celer TaxID=2305508 RepID=A0A494VMX2_9SPHI|nr:hypothetical protein [Mucilaginibacter celer]AYL96696.1 hypothetical protein HYN43_015930 [Mucilaginibacter celer]